MAEIRYMIPVALALGSSLAWGLADFLGGLKSRSLALPTVLLLSQAVGLAITVAIVAVVAGAPPTAATVGWAALSGILDLAGLWALYRGLSRGSMSVVAPLAATAALVPAVYGIATGERPSGVVLGGIVLAGLDAWAGDFEVDGDEGVYVSRVAVKASLPGGRFGDYAAVLGIGVLDLAAVGLFALASLEGLVSVVSTLGSLYPVATVVLARVLLKERMTRGHLLGVTIAMLGVVAITDAGSL